MARAAGPIDMRPGSVGQAHAREPLVERIGMDVLRFDGGTSLMIEIAGFAVLPYHRQALGEFPHLVEAGRDDEGTAAIDVSPSRISAGLHRIGPYRGQVFVE